MSRISNPRTRLLFATLLALTSLESPAQTTTYEEQFKLIKAPNAVTAIGDDLFGDQVNLYNGGLEFRQTDVSARGNNALPVAMGRRLTAGTGAFGGRPFGRWVPEIPRLHGVFSVSKGWVSPTGTTARCSNFGAPASAAGTNNQSAWGAGEFWHGNFIYIPGSGDQRLLRRADNHLLVPNGSGATYPVVTAQFWSLSCLPSLANDTSAAKSMGEGFVAVAPSGTQYRFDWMVDFPGAQLSKALPEEALKAPAPDTTSEADTTAAVPAPAPEQVGSYTLNRKEVWILPTLVTDRHGNWVRYTYDPAAPTRLTRIEASDGRVLTLGYVDGDNFIRSVSHGTRTWRYTYSGADLVSVTLPDNSSWQLADVYPLMNKLANPAPAGDCDSPDQVAGTYTGSMIHPAGATGSFTLTATVHGRSDVPSYCGSASNFTPMPARFFYTNSLTSKTISGPGIGNLTWTTSYGSPNSSVSPCNGCITTKTVSVTDPAGKVTSHVFGNQYEQTEGRIQEIDVGGIRRTIFQYRALGAGPYIDYVGSADTSGGDSVLSSRLAPVAQKIIQQQGVTFSWVANNFDSFARPLNVTRSSSLGMSRTESTAYADHLGKWILGQTKSISADGVAGNMILNNYDDNTANLLSSSKFGVLEQTLTYHADGTLESGADGNGQKIRYSRYRAGLPQETVYPDGTSESADINELGDILGTTSAAGFTTSYGYDAMGRLASITYPAGDSVAWHPTRVTFAQMNDTEYDLAPGHWRQQIVTGNARITRYYDALWRPVYTEHWDSTDAAATMRAVKRQYDFAGRLTYESYPQASVAAIGDGLYHEFDALGRPTVTSANSELGILYSGNAYLDGFVKNTTNARGKTTLTTYQAFDQPSEEAVATVAAPEGVSVEIARDVLGKPLSVTRSGNGKSATRRYVYDPSSQRLCKTIETETGATLQEYDPAGNVLWRASGLDLSSAGSCDLASVPAQKKISFGYDKLNRVTSTSFGDASPAIMREYTADGLPLTVHSNGANWTYGYNRRRLNETENLSYGGVSYLIERGYDAHGAVSRLRYPDGTAVDYNPNALGEPRQVGPFATGITYHPNGAIKGFSYGHGIQHSQTQSRRGLPQESSDSGVLNDLYAYDENGNVRGIHDALEDVSSRAMAYDDLDRLTAVGAPNLFGTAGYAYDALDNITGSTVTQGRTARVMEHVIDPDSNRLTSIVGTAGFNFAYQYDSQGNIVRRGGQAYQFDLANRMQQAAGKATYAYDGWNRRVSVVGADGVNRVQVYSQDGKLLLAGPTGSAKTKYIYLNNHVIAEVGGAGTQYIHTDALGSPVARTDAAQRLISRTRYEPYGHTAAGEVPTIGFTGHVNDPDTGLTYMQQRYYDPIAGRMLSIDPVTTDANTGSSFNRYAYANNNPFKYVDPDGRAVESVTMDKNKNVHIVVGMSYKGAVTPKQANAFNKAIVNAYSGKKGEYAVNVTIIPSEQAKLGNYVTVVDGTKLSTTSGVGARETTLFTNDPAGATMEQVMTHEFGHLAGAFDKYDISGAPNPGYENNIMGSAKSGKVDERTINEILKRNPPKEPKQE